MLQPAATLSTGQR